MIIRPASLEVIEIDIEFNLQDYKFLEIDLNHINKNDRANFSVVELAIMIKILINEKSFSASAQKTFGIDFYSYYVIYEKIVSKLYNLVFGICNDRPNSIGIITFHRA